MTLGRKYRGYVVEREIPDLAGRSMCVHRLPGNSESSFFTAVLGAISSYYHANVDVAFQPRLRGASRMIRKTASLSRAISTDGCFTRSLSTKGNTSSLVRGPLPPCVYTDIQTQDQRMRVSPVFCRLSQLDSPAKVVRRRMAGSYLNGRFVGTTWRRARTVEH